VSLRDASYARLWGLLSTALRVAVGLQTAHRRVHSNESSALVVSVPSGAHAVSSLSEQLCSLMAVRFKHAAICAAIACAAAYLPRLQLVAAILGRDCPTNPEVQKARRALAHLGAESDCQYVQISGSLNQGRSHGV
jgi:hypothetical protein